MNFRRTVGELLNRESHIATDKEKPRFLTQEWIHTTLDNLASREKDNDIKNIIAETTVEDKGGGLTNLTLKYAEDTVVLNYLQADNHPDKINIEFHTTNEKMGVKLLYASQIVLRELEAQKNQGYQTDANQKLIQKIDENKIIEGEKEDN